jgi:hypothetical protein
VRAFQVGFQALKLRAFFRMASIASVTSIQGQTRVGPKLNFGPTLVKSWFRLAVYIDLGRLASKATMTAITITAAATRTPIKIHLVLLPDGAGTGVVLVG